MLKLFFMRHCESEANCKDILASQLDFKLSEKGLKDAEVIASKFAGQFSINRIISSPLTRTLQTAAPFSKIFNIEIETDELLKEQNLGRFAGKSYSEVRNDPEYRWDKSKRWNWIPAGGGESYEMLAGRVKPFLLKLGQIKQNQTILITTHAITLRMLKGHLEMTLPLYSPEIPGNGEIWEVDFSGLGNVHKVKSHVFNIDERKAE
jgi:broad specificity phosphatase PhoE